MIATNGSEPKVINRTGVEASLVVITPAYAQKLLADENRPENRGVSRKVIEQIKGDILANRWVENGQAIVLDEAEHLMDGQHRLTAIVEADRPVRTLIVRGVHRGAFSTLDCGRKRTAADVLAVNGYTNRLRLAAALRIPWMYDNGRWSARDWESTRLGNTEVLGAAKKYPDMPEFLNATAASKISTIQRSAVPGIWYVCHRERPILADKFFNSLCSGIDLEAASPIYKLRERLIKEAHSHGAFRRDSHVAALVTKAWNAYYLGEKCALLRYNPSEAFPKLVFTK